ncbi:WG repeat-containing protein [Hymenobacter sp. BT523]|uniref:WG repeat-containing protein n=1 Tax=Hymenobacter sp. BT523 TaxID=2795725 RepID=UPI0018EB1666|nr:WG repeat-containing protein [Hymenobacter sp. BT523]MBJ6109981.1 WG repeat-containing protein [Hymenobacter sp. BT523]
MVHHFLASPFADDGRATQFAAVLAALQADPTDSLLLGNLVLEDEAAPIDALVVRPHGITVLVLVPTGGRLGMPALSYGHWQLGGAPLAGAEGFDNPFEQFVAQKAAVAAWLRARFGADQVNLHFISGVVLFGAPVAYAPDVEPALNEAPAVFQLLGEPADLPRRLRQLSTPEIDLSSADLAEWAAEWARFAALAPPEPEHGAAPQRPAAAAFQGDEAGPASSFLSQKARALWNWLGAADVPDEDPDYGSYDAAAARREEKQRLEELRRQMQADLSGQLQALEAREAERERSIAQLRAQLAQAPTVAADATALVSRLHAETREKAALEAAMQASRAESAARNRELDAKIQQLGQLLERLNTPVATATAAPQPAGAAPPTGPATESSQPAGKQTESYSFHKWQKLGKGYWLHLLRALRQRPRVAAVVLLLCGVGAWTLSHLGGAPLVPFQENGRWGYADAQGKAVIPARFTTAGPFQAGRAVVARDGAYGFLDEDGKEVVPPAYDALNPYAGGYARVRVGDAYTYIDAAGEEFDHYYFNGLDFAEGHAAVLDHRGWYYITGPKAPDKPVLFKEAYSFVDGLARVKLADGYTFITPGYLDDPQDGTAPFGRYELASDFADGKARVTQHGRSFLIDKRGEEINE